MVFNPILILTPDLTKGAAFLADSLATSGPNPTLDPGEIGDGHGTLHGRTGAVQKVKAID